jgi:hypothetical protein
MRVKDLTLADSIAPELAFDKRTIALLTVILDEKDVLLSILEKRDSADSKKSTHAISPAWKLESDCLAFGCSA